MVDIGDQERLAQDSRPADVQEGDEAGLGPALDIVRVDAEVPHACGAGVQKRGDSGSDARKVGGQGLPAKA